MGEDENNAGWTKLLWPVAFLIAAGLCACSYAYWDQPLAKYFDEHKDLKPAAKYLTLLGDSLWYLPTSLLAFLYFRYRSKSPLWARRFGFIFLTVLISGLLALVMKVSLGRARPGEFLDSGVYGFKLFQMSPKFLSFPSGHGTTCLALAWALSFIFPRWGKLFIPLGVALAFTRVILTAHYLGDVLGGMTLGTFSAILVKAWFDRMAWSLSATVASACEPIPEAKPSTTSAG
ncbi:MAG: phosphatase PAP2 family protein [Planctomycetes bacterium]|nr:phosphatase PAP2 family protein [Planctomycetota bacterium]